MTPSLGLGPGPSRQRLVAMMRSALDEDGFVLFAQPIVDLAGGETLKHELALRLPAGDEEQIPPAGHLPAAEWFGLSIELDDLLIRRAVILARKGHPVAIDISPASTADPGLARRIELAVVEERIDPGLLTVEVSEESLTASARAASAFTQRVHALGCSITVDHFGVGSAGFGYLKRLPVDCLKTDLTLVADRSSTPAGDQLAHAFVSLARALGMRAAADGVADATALASLENAGVDEAQGAFFGAPSALSPDGSLPVRPIAARDAT